MSDTYFTIDFKSFKSIKRRPLSSATLNTTFITPSWASVSSRSLEIKSGPISDMVVLTLWPFFPYTSQNLDGYGLHSKSVIPNLSSLSWIFSLSPAFIMLVRSPLTSARKTGVPMSENVSARTFKVIVLPVPVAPAIKPWRLAIFGIRYISLSLFAIYARFSLFKYMISLLE